MIDAAILSHMNNKYKCITEKLILSKSDSSGKR